MKLNLKPHHTDVGGLHGSGRIIPFYFQRILNSIFFRGMSTQLVSLVVVGLVFNSNFPSIQFAWLFVCERHTKVRHDSDFVSFISRVRPSTHSSCDVCRTGPESSFSACERMQIAKSSERLKVPKMRRTGEIKLERKRA